MMDARDNSPAETETCAHEWYWFNYDRTHPRLDLYGRGKIIMPRDRAMWCENCGTLRWFDATLEPKKITDAILDARAKAGRVRELEAALREAQRELARTAGETEAAQAHREHVARCDDCAELGVELLTAEHALERLVLANEEYNEDAVPGMVICFVCDAMPWEAGDPGEFEHEPDCALVAARKALAPTTAQAGVAQEES